MTHKAKFTVEKAKEWDDLKSRFASEKDPNRQREIGREIAQFSNRVHIGETIFNAHISGPLAVEITGTRTTLEEKMPGAAPAVVELMRADMAARKVAERARQEEERKAQSVPDPIVSAGENRLEKRQRARRLKATLASTFLGWYGGLPRGSAFDEYEHSQFCEYLRKTMPTPPEGWIEGVTLPTHAQCRGWATH
ncbi:MAG: hypothetical protein NTW86_10695 [Candidatus Sumerlaeota bacterium]|nr:hypothetical protein [Candidatus Sumerlaeota bacterium]